MEQNYPLRQAYEYCPEEEDSLDYEGTDGLNKFWSWNRF
jgi:hypothetical protein